MDAKLSKAIKEVILCVTSSSEYKMCLELKEKMRRNEEIMQLISSVKEQQKKYVRSNYDIVIKDELAQLEKRLNEIPIYVIYLQKLQEVNKNITIIEDFLNTYFYDILNENS